MTLDEEIKQRYIDYSVDRKFLLDGLVNAGFTREEALRLMTAPQVQINTPPEQAELTSRMTSLLNRELSEMDE